ncbi:MAG: iron dependent repressor, metal binding and dimerization domain protein, partial [Phycisphaeraceae bacterium]|nr:iron dependent repressor, metal binding and dimerization domain protein [Phycisphaeraceae bacterium]
ILEMPAGRWKEALAALRKRGRVVETPEGQLQLTEPGRRRAREIVRSHRLWETWLADKLNLPEDHVHPPAAELEHLDDQRVRDHLEAQKPATATDPHGREIPGEHSGGEG